VREVLRDVAREDCHEEECHNPSDSGAPLLEKYQRKAKADLHYARDVYDQFWLWQKWWNLSEE